MEALDASLDLADSLAEVDSATLMRWERELRPLLGSPGWNALRDLALELRERELMAMHSSVKPLEQAEYARGHGLVHGIDLVLAIPDSVVSRARALEAELDEASVTPIRGTNGNG